MILRHSLEKEIAIALGRSRAVVLVGPRQSGKSTLAQKFLLSNHPNYFDLENPLHLQRLNEPLTTLSQLNGLVVIDEVQRKPDLFPLLRVLIDRSNKNGQYLLLGSAAPELMRQSGESLLGRTETIHVHGFNLAEIITSPEASLSANQNTLWHRGGFPRSFLALSDDDSFTWRTNAIANHLQIDLPQFGINIAVPAIQRFWYMLAHYHAQIWSAAPIAQSMGVSEPTIRKYLDVLTQTLMIRQLQPWHQNLAKRQVKAPKIYFRDSGYLNALMGVSSLAQLLIHPACGASWEGFALEQTIRIAKPDQAYFWATHQGAELDLLMIKGSNRIGVEFKRTDVPKVTKSMRIAIDDLQLNRLYVVYPGQHRFNIEKDIEAVPLSALLPSL